MMSILIFALVLSFLVLIHELGHFLAAVYSGMKVEEFGLGYPPRATTLFTWNETKFSLNWIPFGGFVQLEGENEPNGKFNSYAVGKRLLVILAGATVNFIFGVLAFSLVFSVVGIPQELEQPRIAQVMTDSPAEQAGLNPQTNITAFTIEEQKFEMQDVETVIEFVKQHRGQEVTAITTGPCQDLSCGEEKNQFEVYLRTKEETPDNQGSLGVVFKTTLMRHYPWYQMPFRGTWYGLNQALWLGQMIMRGLGQMVVDLVSLQQVPKDIAGPIGIVHQASEQEIFAGGWLAVLSFGGMLSINLAVLNLLPIPALDGGRAFFVIIGQLIGKDKIQKIEHWTNYGGYVFLFGLLILVTVKDVVNLFR